MLRLQSLVLFLLLLASLISVQTTIRKISVQIPLDTHQLPITIHSLLQRSNISVIKMQMFHKAVPSIIKSNPISSGISTFIFNQSVLDRGILEQLATIFSFSASAEKFMIYQPYSKMTIISDPNDKFCIEQFQNILALFLPCKHQTVHLQPLLYLQDLFQNNIGIQIQWNKNANLMNLNFILYGQKQNVQYASTNICGNIRVISQVYQNNNLFSTNEKIQYQVTTINKWYHPLKRIVHTLKTISNSHNYTVLIVTHLPFAFTFQRLTVIPNDRSYIITQSHHLHTNNIAVVLHLQPQIIEQIVIAIDFKAHLPPIQFFQTIGGGGQQILAKSFVFKTEKGRDQKYQALQELQSDVISVRYIEPDFSIPFHTITFTMGIIGYLYINLWRLHKSRS